MTLRLFAALAFLPALASADQLPAGAFARLGSAKWRHPEQPLALAIHPDGKTLASGGADGLVRVWDAATGEVRHTIRLKAGIASALAYSADGKWLAAHFNDDLVRVYSTDKYVALKTVPGKSIEHLELSGDGSLMLAGGPLGQPALLEVATGQDRMDLPKGRVAALMPGGEAVAVVADTDAVLVLEIPSGKPVRTVPLPKDLGQRATHLAVHPLGKRVAVAGGASGEGAVRVYDFGKDEPRFTLTDAEGPVAFVGETAVVTRLKGKLAVWDGTTGKLLRTAGEGVTTLAVAPDGAFAATDGGATFPSPRVFLWDVKTGGAKNLGADEVVDIRTAVPHPDGGLVVATGDKLVRWKPGETKPADLLAGGVRATAATGSNVFVATESDKVFALAAPDKPFAKLPKGVRFLATDAAGKRLACATGADKAELAIVDVATGEVVRGWPLSGRPLAVALDPTGARVAVLGRDGYARVWDTNAAVEKDKTPPELWKERTARSFRAGLAFSPDGTKLAFTSLMRVSVHEAATGKPIALFDRAWDDGPYTSVAFTPDGRFLTAGTQGTSGAAVVWELMSRQRAGRFGSDCTVTGVAFLDDGRTLVTTGSDDNLLAWDRTVRRGKEPPTNSELAAAWLKLGDIDPETAYWAVATVSAGGKKALPFVMERLSEEKRLTESVMKWAAQLDAKEFAVRDEATKQLVGVGGAVLPVLDEFEKTPRSAEWTQRAKIVRGRIRVAAESLPDPSLVGVPLRLLRAVAALESNPDATAALEAIHDLGGPAGEDATRVLKARKK